MARGGLGAVLCKDLGDFGFGMVFLEDDVDLLRRSLLIYTMGNIIYVCREYTRVLKKAMK